MLWLLARRLVLGGPLVRVAPPERVVVRRQTYAADVGRSDSQRAPTYAPSEPGTLPPR